MLDTPKISKNIWRLLEQTFYAGYLHYAKRNSLNALNV